MKSPVYGVASLYQAASVCLASTNHQTSHVTRLFMYIVILRYTFSLILECDCTQEQGSIWQPSPAFEPWKAIDEPR